jgi:hypothetical protein
MNVGEHWQGVSRSRCASALAVVGILTLYFIVVPRPSEKTLSSVPVTPDQPADSANRGSNLPASVIRHARFDGARVLENRLYQLQLKQAAEMPRARPFSTDLIDQRYTPDFDTGLLR